MTFSLHQGGVVMSSDPTPRRGSHVKSDKTHTVIKIHPLAHILDI